MANSVGCVVDKKIPAESHSLCRRLRVCDHPADMGKNEPVVVQLSIELLFNVSVNRLGDRSRRYRNLLRR